MSGWRRSAPCAVAFVVIAAAGSGQIVAAALASAGQAGLAPSREAGASIFDGVYTASQASRGQRRFEQVCATCHQLSEHTGRRFAVKWEGTSVGELFDVISTTMPEANPGELPPAEYSDIVAFLLRENGYPQGSEELPSDLAALSKVRIEPLPK